MTGRFMFLTFSSYILIFQKIKKFHFFKLYVYEYFAWMCACVPCVRWVSTEARIEHWIPGIGATVALLEV